LTIKGNYLSFYDNKYLTNEIDLFIACVTNGNEISPKINLRLRRIKTVSRIFRCFVLANLVFSVCFWALAFLTSSSGGIGITVQELLRGASVLLMLFWFWKLSRLFRFHERGLIFAAETIRCIKVLGIICVIGWITLVAVRFTPSPVSVPHNPSANVHSIKVMPMEKHSFRVGFFSFDFGTGIDFGTPFVGASVILAAWIMDEGRKIQEEQELTV
jgi:hypothetical protein